MRGFLAGLVVSFALASTALAQTPDAALIARAEAGDFDAALDAAMELLQAGDTPGALRFATMAADAGNAEGMNLMAILLQDSDPAASRAWEDRAVVAGSDGARLNRGLRALMSATDDAEWDAGIALVSAVQSERIGPILDEMTVAYQRSAVATPARIYQFTQLAAERGAPGAQWRYAMRLLNGDGGPRDVEAAYQWARRSGEGGYIDGMISTAVMLATGEGVAENDAEARLWYELAANRGSAHALRGLAWMLLSGEGGEADLARGWAYLTLAADGGDTAAQTARPQIDPQIPVEARAEAEAIRAEWRAAHPPEH